MRYLYIDESGDLGGQSKYLVISAVMVEHPKRLDRIIKNMRRGKFRKQLKKAIEIKANKSSTAIIEHMLKKLGELDEIRTFHVVLKKADLYSKFLKQDKHKQYNFVARHLAEKICLPYENLEIFIDKSKGKKVLRDDFNQYFESFLRKGSDVNCVNIRHSESHAWSGLQFADILAWSIFQQFEHKNDRFVQLLNRPVDISLLFRKRTAPTNTNTCTSRYTG